MAMIGVGATKEACERSNDEVGQQRRRCVSGREPQEGQEDGGKGDGREKGTKNQVIEDEGEEERCWRKHPRREELAVRGVCTWWTLGLKKEEGKGRG